MLGYVCVFVCYLCVLVAGAMSLGVICVRVCSRCVLRVLFVDSGACLCVVLLRVRFGVGVMWFVGVGCYGVLWCVVVLCGGVRRRLLACAGVQWLVIVVPSGGDCGFKLW